MEWGNKTLLVIVGPTAVGKTDLCVQLAQELNTEIISADSRQFYRELSIGTAKPSLADQGGVTHHFIDSHSIHDYFSPGDFEREALLRVTSLFEQHDFVIATGVQFSVRQFIQWSAQELGIGLRFEGKGVEEKATVTSIQGDMAPGLKVGDVVVQIDPRYFRPTEVETLLGDPSKAKQKLGWTPEITVQEMCAEMVREDLEQATKAALLKKHGYKISISAE